VGSFVRSAGPHTEADSAAILVSTLVPIGVAIGPTPYVLAGNDRHGTNLFVAVIGQTSKGGKGTSYAVARSGLERLDDAFTRSRILGGFGSGEAVVDAVRDPIGDDDQGASDKRLLVFEPEFGRMLKVAGQEGSVLSMVVRDAWDGRRLETRSRGRTAVATGAHIGVVAHSTVEELRARMTDVEVYGGLAGRFLYVAARRSQLLSAGGNVPEEVFTALAETVRGPMDAARRTGRFCRTPGAEERWEEIYHELAADDPGALLGAATARDAPQCLRLSLLYALLDGASAIDLEHVEAAYALWRYCRASAAYVFGDSLGDEVADKLYEAIVAAGPIGMTGTEQRDLFGRHVGGKRLEVARAHLEDRGLIFSFPHESGGRPILVSVATKATEATKAP